ncbi:MAG: heparan-alpha-glucosaminide N-acetyltransferase domain-containing protein [Promethearchaeota archaeon]|jgi:uncharacterized membrane protein
MGLQRLKSIDIFRGLCMAWMILTHLIDWWLKSEFNWLHNLMIMIFDPIGASGFLFISGISVTLSYRNRISKIKMGEEGNLRTLRNSYLMRALFFLIIAIVYNSLIAISLKDPIWIWTWFILLTAALSLFIAWPLLKTSKLLRIIIGCMIWVANPFIISILLPYEGTLSVFGVIFHIFYHGLHQVPILVFFPFFLFGTVIGDVLFDVFHSEFNLKDERKLFRYKYLILTMIIGIFLVILGVIFNFPRFLLRESVSWVIYSLGVNIIIISILISFELFEIIKAKKSYKLLFYFSYYSLTIFLSHNLLHFLFLNQLTIVDIWFFTGAAFVFISIMLRTIYNKYHGSASLKVQISRLSYAMIMKLNEKPNKK